MIDQTPAVALMRAANRAVIGGHFVHTNRHTLEEIKRVLRSTYETMLVCNVRFELEDVALIDAACGGRYGSSFYFDPVDEDWYGLACQHNASAAASIEKYAKRVPFFLPKPESIFMWDERTKLPPNCRRLFVGAKFLWTNGFLKVTSFNHAERDSYLTACSYDRYGKVVKCLKFTPASLLLRKTANEMKG